MLIRTLLTVSLLLMFSCEGVDIGRGQFGQRSVGGGVAVVGIHVDGDQSKRMNGEERTTYCCTNTTHKTTNHVLQINTNTINFL